MEFHIQQAEWNEHQDKLRAIRYEVFVIGQSVPVEIEQDDQDPFCSHLLATHKDGAAIGTARVDRQGHIGRVAVLESFRGHGVGTQLMRAAVDCVRLAGGKYAILNSQISAVAFYEQLGFQKAGDEFVEAGIVHVEMRKLVAADG